ncbi:MAG TPA: hypothetical protein VIT22_06830 [Pseudoxanthomonas sp.]
MKDKMVFVKTDAGRQEMRDRGHKLPTALRPILLRVDGQRDLSQLRELMTGLHAPDDAIEQLIGMGLIQSDRGTEIPVAPAPRNDVSRYRLLYGRLTEAVRQHLGLKGYFIQLKVERSTDSDMLLALLPEIATAITKAKGHAFATEWLAQIHAEAQV